MAQYASRSETMGTNVLAWAVTLAKTANTSTLARTPRAKTMEYVCLPMTFWANTNASVRPPFTGKDANGRIFATKKEPIFARKGIAVKIWQHCILYVPLQTVKCLRGLVLRQWTVCTAGCAWVLGSVIVSRLIRDPDVTRSSLARIPVFVLPTGSVLWEMIKRRLANANF